ncbi:interleukin-6 receptor subunit beta-like isoform X2 [Genypterus blacodes]|uniref:interleukin-6 receptor subunit beta-like isoform X2 n=1 Tax=Genypterus blacodes TaxID=154954 RepID=UPI003F773492
MIPEILQAKIGQRGKRCSVVPKDKYIEMGSAIEIECHSSCIRGNVFWTLNNIQIDESLSETVNSSYSILSLKNFTHPSAVLQCHSVLTEQVLGGTTIKTYSKPNKISCLVQCKDQTVVGTPDLIKCSWQHAATSSLKISYSLSVLEHNGSKEICSSDTTSCSGDLAVSFFRKHSIIVRAKTEEWNTSSDPYEFLARDRFKINRPVIRLNLSSLLLVEWDRPFESEIFHCQVKHNKSNQVLNTSHQGSRKVMIDKLGSCMKYTVSARCALGKAPWSDWSQEQTVLTDLNKSDVKLQLWRKVAEPDKNGLRDVRAMWREIPPACRGSFSYTIEALPLGKGGKHGILTCSAPTCDFNVTQDAHTIILTVFHNGVQLVEDSVYIPAIGENLSQVSDIQTLSMEGDILVRWEAPLQPVSGYVIDWTHDGVEYFWKESKYTYVTLLDLLDYTPYNITVTPILHDTTGNGTQAREICSRMGYPGSVSIDVTAKDKRALVSWTVDSQKPCSGAVVNYTVFYGTPNGLQLNVTLDSTNRSVWLVNLKPNTQYIVSISASALTGNSRSVNRYFGTTRFDPDLVAALIICGSIATVLVLVLGLSCVVLWKKFWEKAVPDPGVSSVALWRSPIHHHQKSFQPFCVPAESDTICERVYPCKDHTLTSPTAVPATDCNGNPHPRPTSDQADKNTHSDNILAPDPTQERPTEPVQTAQSSFGETTVLLTSQNDFHRPYRQQSSVELPAPTTNKPCKHITRQQDKTAPMAVYVTLDMFQQGQTR